MKAKRRSIEEKVRILRKADGEMTVLQVCDEHNISEQTLYRWKKELGPFLFGWNNFGIIDAVPQHSDLIFLQLEPGIVTRHEKSRQQNENHRNRVSRTIPKPD